MEFQNMLLGLNLPRPPLQVKQSNLDLELESVIIIIIIIMKPVWLHSLQHGDMRTLYSACCGPIFFSCC